MTFFKRNPLAGLVLGLVLVAVGLFSLPMLSDAADAGTPGADCRAGHLQSDLGYGLESPADRAPCR